jgi:hypothetical protein
MVFPKTTNNDESLAGIISTMVSILGKDRRCRARQGENKKPFPIELSVKS